MIPEAAVEAAAKAQYEEVGLLWDDGMVPDWECEDDSLQESYRASARLALEAAAPHMLNPAPVIMEGPSEGADAVTGFPRAAYRKRRMG